MVRSRLPAQVIDEVLAGSFPASDPPAWTPGIARPSSDVAEVVAGTGDAPEERRASSADVVDVSPPPRRQRTVIQGLLSLSGAAGVILLAPLAILAVGAPIALGVRAISEVAGWLLTIVR